MSSEIALKAENISKRYQIYDNPRDRLKQFIMPRLQRRIGNMPRQYFKEFWALRNVSIEITKGKTIGIIGRNGSGKSTLLQIICGTLNPTGGSIETNGRIAPLLELGSGFNPQFTGRENVYMNAAVLGMSREEVDERFDDIASFADIGAYIEQPIQTYSSGMVVRLAFAVAINADPEILVVDEALSVGDELFQRKCFSRIEAIKGKGATILFVSHSGATIIQLCDSAVLLDSGEKLTEGEPEKIVGRYQKLLYAPEEKREAIREQVRTSDENIMVSDNAVKDTSPKMSTYINPPGGIEESYDPNLVPSSTIKYESHGANIESPHVLTLAGERVNNLIRGKEYFYIYTVHFNRSASNVRFGMLIKTVSGVALGGGVSANWPGESIVYVPSGTIYRVIFRFRCILNTGVYFLNAGTMGDVNGAETYLHRLIDAAMFRVINAAENLSNGIVDFGCVTDYEILNEKA